MLLQGYGLIFYGDSITESLRGTDKCRDVCLKSKTRSSCKGIPEVREATGQDRHSC